MNTFDSHFFQKYVPEGHTLVHIVHVHPITILAKISLYLGLLVVIPSWLYYSSAAIQDLLPFYVFEVYLFLLYAKLIYDIFDWYNDVWMITDRGIISLERSLFKVNTDTLDHKHIEGMGVEKNSILDMLFKKGDLIVHKFGEESYVLESAKEPFAAVDIVESIEVEKDDTTFSNEKLHQVLKKLSSNIEAQNAQKNLDEQMKIIEKNEAEAKEKYLEKIRKKEGTIDLREAK